MRTSVGLTLATIWRYELWLEVLAHGVSTVCIVMSFVVVENKDWKSVCILLLKLECQVLHEIVKAPFVCALFKFDVESIAESRPYATKNSERLPLILARRYWDR